MYVPYLTPVAPYYPLQPIGIPHGLSHTGIPHPQMPVPGSSFGWINPLQYGAPMQSIYGPTFGAPYRPVGYGLSHAPYLPEASYGLPSSYGVPSPMGYGAMQPIPHVHGIAPMQPGIPLQPNWSQIHPLQQQPTI